MAAIKIAHAVSVLYVQWWLRSNRPRRINSINVGYGHDRGRPSHAHIFSSKARIAGECAQGLSRTSIIVWQVCHKGYLADVYGWLASMPKGCLAPAPIAGKYAQGLSCSSINCWRVCPRAISLQHQLLASMPEGYLAPAALLASMP